MVISRSKRQEAGSKLAGFDYKGCSPSAAKAPAAAAAHSVLAAWLWMCLVAATAPAVPVCARSMSSRAIFGMENPHRMPGSFGVCRHPARRSAKLLCKAKPAIETATNLTHEKQLLSTKSCSN